MPRGSYSAQYKPPKSSNPICGTPGVGRRHPYKEPPRIQARAPRQEDMIPAYPPPRPKFFGPINVKKGATKITDDTDDGYDECQTSDESSDMECNNVVRAHVNQSTGYDTKQSLNEFNRHAKENALAHRIIEVRKSNLAGLELQ